MIKRSKFQSEIASELVLEKSKCCYLVQKSLPHSNPFRIQGLSGKQGHFDVTQDDLNLESLPKNSFLITYSIYMFMFCYSYWKINLKFWRSIHNSFYFVLLTYFCNNAKLAWLTSHSDFPLHRWEFVQRETEFISLK